MGLYDQHSHTWYSVDSEADPATNVRRALERGLAGVSFTDHFDTHPIEWPFCRYDYEKIARMIADLRAEVGNGLFIGHGIEICFQPDLIDMILNYLDDRTFDIVILSVHWFDGRALHLREYWDGHSSQSGTHAYLQAVLKAVRFAGRLRAERGRRVFDVLGHLDLAKRYTQRFFGRCDVDDHRDLIDEILRACLEADLVPEVNLSSLRQASGEPMPAFSVAGRYAELGGEAMSVGTDAHRPEHIGEGVAQAAAELGRQGIRRQAVFKGRERCDEPMT